MTQPKTNKELKVIAITALKNEYGFAPKQSEITLLEAHDNGTYILFRVNGKEYSFNSHIITIAGTETVWCGNGTVDKMRVRECQYAYGEQY